MQGPTSGRDSYPPRETHRKTSEEAAMASDAAGAGSLCFVDVPAACAPLHVSQAAPVEGLRQGTAHTSRLRRSRR